MKMLLFMDLGSLRSLSPVGNRMYSIIYNVILNLFEVLWPLRGLHIFNHLCHILAANCDVETFFRMSLEAHLCVSCRTQLRRTERYLVFYMCDHAHERL